MATDMQLCLLTINFDQMARSIYHQGPVCTNNCKAEEVISRHGVPRQLLSDRGAAFQSRLMLEVCSVMGIKKINTSAYHPLTDGLVERFNRTLTDMLAKTVAPGVEWDDRLPYVLFAYRVTQQAYTGESPFFLLYGHDPQLPSEVALTPPVSRENVHLDDYKSSMLCAMREAWELAQRTLEKAQKRQKHQHDKNARNAEFQVGDRVFTFMPGLKSGPDYKLSCPYRGPYRIVELYPNGADLCPVDCPRMKEIRVALNLLRRCPAEISTGHEMQEPCPDHLSTTDATAQESTGSGIGSTAVVRNEPVDDQRSIARDDDTDPPSVLDPHISPWKGRLRRKESISGTN